MVRSEYHRFVVVEVEPTFDDAINDPAEVGEQNRHADQNEEGCRTDQRPQQTKHDQSEKSYRRSRQYSFKFVWLLIHIVSISHETLLLILTIFPNL